MRLLRKKERELDPTTKVDLEQIDAALASGDARDQLAELALELRADRPVPRNEFLTALDERVAEGFPPPPREHDQTTVAAGAEPARPTITWERLRRSFVPVVAGGAALAVAVVAVTTSGVLSSNNSNDGLQVSQAPKTSTPPRTFEKEVAPSAIAGEGGAAGTAAPESDLAAPPVAGRPSDAVRQRRQIKNAQLTLGASPGDIEEVSDGVIEVADKYRGFVVNSEVSSGDGSNAGATIELRIPAAKVQAAVADLSKLGHVIERTQGTEDVTGQFVSLRTRLTNATEERKALLNRLGNADSSQEAASIKAQLRSTDARIASIRAQQKRLNARVDFSTVSVAVQPDSGAGKDDDKFTPGDALSDAGDILGAALGAVVIALAVLIPLGAIIALVWFATAGLRQRRRESALDSQAPVVTPEPGGDDQ